MAQRAVGTNPDAASVDAPVDVVGWEGGRRPALFLLVREGAAERRHDAAVAGAVRLERRVLLPDDLDRVPFGRNHGGELRTRRRRRRRALGQRESRRIRRRYWRRRRFLLLFPSFASALKIFPKFWQQEMFGGRRYCLERNGKELKNFLHPVTKLTRTSYK